MYQFKEWPDRDLDIYISSNGEILPEWIHNPLLHPSFPQKLKPRKSFKIKISEKTGFSMIFGLLGIIPGYAVACECNIASIWIAIMFIVSLVIVMFALVRGGIELVSWLGNFIEFE